MVAPCFSIFPFTEVDLLFTCVVFLGGAGGVHYIVFCEMSFIFLSMKKLNCLPFIYWFVGDFRYSGY